MYARSPRFRQLMGMVEYGVAISCPEALKAYVDSLDPGLWLLRAARTSDRARADEMRRVAGFLDEAQIHARQVKVWRKLFADFCILRDDFGRTGMEGKAVPAGAHARTAISLVHAVRLAILHEVIRLATHVPPFSSQHNTTHQRVIQRVLHLDIPIAVEQLRHIFPAEVDDAFVGDFGEKATYVSDEVKNYRQENERIFGPMTNLYELLRRCSVALVHRIGFFG